FPMLQVSGEYEVKDNTVSFELESGCATLKCKIVADVTKQVRVVGSLMNPEESKDQFYDQLVVDDRTHVEVVGTEYVETPIGLLFQLTSTQVADLNKQLEYYAEELADEEAGVV
ncbi:hypothetical protein, partial [Acinetobacter nosocomialis]|uniref:hypothetical protein n=1 Tax=Acinetobacter nosocomialis TaxID=106654 RepID=UPI002D1F4133